MDSKWVILGGVLSVSAAAAASAAQDIKVSLISVPSYSTGGYGSATETVSMYNVPVTAKMKKGAFSAKATASYLIVSTSGTSTTTSTSGFGPKSSGGKTSGSTNAVSGLGDIWLDARLRVMDGAQAIPDVTPYVKTKIPTASAGLGSGYQDYEGGMALEWVWGKTSYPFIDVGVRSVADATGARKNVSMFDAGVSYGLSKTTFITALIARDQSVRVSTADPLDVIVSWSHFYEPKSGVQAYLDKGLSTGSPDFAIGIGFERKF